MAEARMRNNVVLGGSKVGKGHSCQFLFSPLRTFLIALNAHFSFPAAQSGPKLKMMVGQAEFLIASGEGSCTLGWGWDRNNPRK